MDNRTNQTARYTKPFCKGFLGWVVWFVPNLTNVQDILFGKFRVVISLTTSTVKRSMALATKLAPVGNITKVFVAYVGVFSRIATTFFANTLSWVRSVEPRVKIAVRDFWLPVGMFFSKTGSGIGTPSDSLPPVTWQKTSRFSHDPTFSTIRSGIWLSDITTPTFTVLHDMSIVALVVAQVQQFITLPQYVYYVK
jgi:hypothetical protein